MVSALYFIVSKREMFTAVRHSRWRVCYGVGNFTSMHLRGDRVSRIER